MPLCAKARHGDLRAPSATNSAMKGPCRFQFVARSFGSIGPPASACLELRAKSEGGGSFLSLQGASRRGSCCAARRRSRRRTGMFAPAPQYRDRRRRAEGRRAAPAPQRSTVTICARWPSRSAASSWASSRWTSVSSSARRCRCASIPCPPVRPDRGISPAREAVRARQGQARPPLQLVSSTLIDHDTVHLIYVCRETER